MTTLIIGMSGVGVTQTATLPPAPTTPGLPTPVPSGGGGGGTYNPPQEIYPKVIPIKNSTGVIIGNVTARSVSDITFEAQQVLTVNGKDITVLIQGKLVSLPSAPRLDIIGEIPNGSKLPSELNLKTLLAQVNLTNFSSDWSLYPNSLKITLKLPKALADGVDLSKSVVVRYGGLSYELLYPSVAGPDANGTISFTITPANETFKANSYSEYTLAASPAVTPTPIVSPSPSPTASPTGGGIDTTTILLALILILVVAAAFVAYFYMQKKH